MRDNTGADAPSAPGPPSASSPPWSEARNADAERTPRPSHRASVRACFTSSPCQCECPSDGQRELGSGAEAGVRGQHPNQPAGRSGSRRPLWRCSRCRRVGRARLSPARQGRSRSPARKMKRRARLLGFEAVDHEPQAAVAATPATRPGRENPRCETPRRPQRHCRRGVSEHGFGGSSREIILHWADYESELNQKLAKQALGSAWSPPAARPASSVYQVKALC